MYSFFWQEKYYFCLPREEGHPASHTTQERNGFRQNYSSSMNVGPSLKSKPELYHFVIFL